MILLLCFVSIMIIPTSMQSTVSKKICQYPEDPSCRNRQELFLRVLDDQYRDDVEYLQALRSLRSRQGRQKKLKSKDDNDVDQNKQPKKKRQFMPIVIMPIGTSDGILG